MYKLGDHVFYPKGGVFIVQTETDKTIAGRNISFYDLVSCDGKTKISVPRANIERVGVRCLISSQELSSHLGSWAPDVKISKLHHKNRKSRFESLRQTGNFRDMGQVMVTIHHLIDRAKATFEEKRMYDQIRKRIADEVEIVECMNSNAANELLQDALDDGIRRPPINYYDGNFRSSGFVEDEEALEEELERV